MTAARRLVSLLLAGSQLAAPAVAGAVTVGLADQKPASYADPRARALGLRYARLSVPYDAATSAPAQVEAWLSAVQGAGMAPHVAFEHLRTDDCPGAPCTLPSRGRYGAAVRAFVARFPQVRTYTTWNEANHQTQPTAAHPEAVAGYYDELRSACPACTIVAGDVLDSGSYTRWLRGFLAAASTTPQLWGLHDYGDVTYGTSSGVRDVLATVPGRLWIEETGALVSLRNQAGRQTLLVDESRVALAIDRAFALAKVNPRIARMYVYQWQAGPLDRFDSGLVRPDGTFRPSYTALVRDLAAARTTAPVRWTAKWSKRGLVLRATCRAADHACRGRVSVALRTRTTSHRLTRRSYRTSARHPTAALSVRVSTTLRRRARNATSRALLLRVRSLAPPAALQTLTLRLARPA